MLILNFPLYPLYLDPNNSMFIIDLKAMTSHIYLEAKSMPTPPFPTPSSLSQFVCPGSTSKTHPVLQGMSLFPRCSNLLPLSLCYWNNNTSTLCVASLRNLLCLRILRGSLRPLKLHVKTCNFIR